MPNIIAISGKSGCGNTTVSKLVAEELGLAFVNYTFRAMAEEMGIPFVELLRLASGDFSYDRHLDSHQVELARRQDCVIGSRLALWMVPDARLKIYLRASPEVRAGRIRNREGGSLAEVISFTAERDRLDKIRYREIYGIDNDDFSGADLVINADRWDAGGVASMIVEAYRTLSDGDAAQG
jgi:cytidylate kinase